MTIDLTKPSVLSDQVPAGLYLPSHVIKVVEVAKKYAGPEGEKITRTPEYTPPGGPNSYHCSKNATAWTQGFFPGLLWLLIERNRLVPGSLGPYSEEEIIHLARRYQSGFEEMKRPADNHDQGFRFQLSFGRDYQLTGNEHGKEVMIEASESMLDRYNPVAGSFRSWDRFYRENDYSTYSLNNMDEHWLVIIDTMMNLDMMYEATRLTSDDRYADAATIQAEKAMDTHIRPDGTTYHVVNVDQKTGKYLQRMTAQGYSDESCWSRGQAWGIYGYAQCALRTGRQDFLDTSRRLADTFLSFLGPEGVPAWDFKAPKPCPFDASAGTVAARGLQMLYQLLRSRDPKAAEAYLARANKLVEDILQECLSPAATLTDGKVDWGKDGWETLLMHSTIAGYEKATRRFMDHGLVYADYYLIEFSNEAIKIDAERAGAKVNGAVLNGVGNGTAAHEAGFLVLDQNL